MSFLADNLHALSLFHPQLVQTGEGEPGGDIIVSTTASGEPTATRDGAYIHSRYHPRREAAAMVAEHPAGTAEHHAGMAEHPAGTVELPAGSIGAGAGAGGSSARAGGSDVPGRRGPSPTVGIILGFGLGYAVEEFRRVHPSLPLLVIEQDPDMFRIALRARDLSPLLRSPDVHLLVGPQPQDITPYLEELPMGNPVLLRVRSLTEKNAGYFRPLEEVIHSFILRRDININTLARFGRLWVRNLASNILPFLLSPGAGMCADMFRGIPALLLAGGPSLDMILPHLKELSRRFLIVSVDTPLSACLSVGTAPDFLVMVDPQFWASRYLDWTEEYNGFMVAEPSTHPRALRGHGRRVLMASSLFPLGALLEEHTEAKGKLGAGGSVSTSAWDFCRLLGCGPIYVAGMDLGFPGHRTHCAGAFFEQSWLSMGSRLSPAESRAFVYLREIGVFPMPSNSGAPTLTDRRMLLYKWWFESQLSGEAGEKAGPSGDSAGPSGDSAGPSGDSAASPALELNAVPDAGLDAARAMSYSLSPAALAIKGMPLALLEDALRLPVIRQEIDAVMERARARADAFSAGRKDAARGLERALSVLASDLDELELLSKKGLEATGYLERLLKGDGTRAPGAAHGSHTLAQGPGPHVAAKEPLPRPTAKEPGARDGAPRMPASNPDAVLRSLDLIDRRILDLSSRNVVGFLMQGLIHRILGASSRAAGREEILSSSRQIYEGIGESARFHREVLSRAVKTLAQYYGA